jgi:hypothetical protein
MMNNTGQAPALFEVEAQEPASERKHPRIKTTVGTSNANHFSSRHGKSLADKATYIWRTLPALGLSRLRGPTQQRKLRCNRFRHGSQGKSARGSYIAVGPRVRHNLGDRRFPYREPLGCALCGMPNTSSSSKRNIWMAY